jgi:CubicO group peptidase (beta-lactamase class C family)
MKYLSIITSIFLLVTNTPAQEMVSRIDSLFVPFNASNVPGASVMVIQHGKPVFAKAYGMANLEEKIPATTKTNYRLASVTKQFTAMCIMMLEEQGKLSYENILTDFFPDFPAYGKKITVKNILQHTSGLIDYEAVMPETTTVQLLDKDVLALMKKQDSTYFKPGTQYRYSNTGYSLLALIVERASGKTFAQFLKENIFLPLKMSETVAFENGISTVSNRVYGYTRDTVDTTLFHRTDQSMTSAVLGDGGIYSSVEDMFKWDQSLYTAKLVSAKTLAMAFTPNEPMEKNYNEYGFGWRISDYKGVKRIQHSGSTIGFRTEIQRYPDRELTVIVLVNRDGADPGIIASRISDMFLFSMNNEH